MRFDVMRESFLVCRPAAPSEDATASAAAGTDQAEGASTSEIMDMIEELVEEAGSSEDTVSLLLSLKLLYSFALLGKLPRVLKPVTQSPAYTAPVIFPVKAYAGLAHTLSFTRS